MTGSSTVWLMYKSGCSFGCTITAFAALASIIPSMRNSRKLTNGMRPSGVANIVIVHPNEQPKSPGTGLARAQPACFRAFPRIPTREVAKFKESDPTSLSLFVDLALLNRLVRSLPRNSLPDHPPNPVRTSKHTHKQTRSPGSAPARPCRHTPRAHPHAC